MKVRLTLRCAPGTTAADAIRGIRALIKRLWRNHKMKLERIETDEN